MHIKSVLIGSALMVLSLAMFEPAGIAQGATTTQPPTTYYLALGDSLSTGVGATSGQGYVDDVYATEKSIIPGLELENLGCAGDSSTRMIHGGLCHNYTTGNQLGDAEAFLASHKGTVKFVTIDIGGDDINGCAPTNETCVQKGLQALTANMPIILGGLRAAGGNVPIVGMTYYDPWLALYLNGPSGEQAATSSLAVLHQLNSNFAVLSRTTTLGLPPYKRHSILGTRLLPDRSTAGRCHRTWQISVTGRTAAILERHRPHQRRRACTHCRCLRNPIEARALIRHLDSGPGNRW